MGTTNLIYGMTFGGLVNAYNEAERACYESSMQQIREIKDKLRATQDEYDRRRNHAKQIVDTLQKFGLQVVSVAGNSIYAQPIPGGKFRFVQFEGYTARGDGRNHRRLEARAATLSKALSTATGLRVAVNQFSLEVRKAGSEHTQSVIIDVQS